MINHQVESDIHVNVTVSTHNSSRPLDTCGHSDAFDGVIVSTLLVKVRRDVSISQQSTPCPLPLPTCILWGSGKSPAHVCSPPMIHQQDAPTARQ